MPLRSSGFLYSIEAFSWPAPLLFCGLRLRGAVLGAFRVRLGVLRRNGRPFTFGAGFGSDPGFGCEGAEAHRADS